MTNARNKLSLLLPLMALTACGSDNSSSSAVQPDEVIAKTFAIQTGTDLNQIEDPLLSLNPGGPGGSPNQSQRAGDILRAEADTDSLLIGALGVDVLIGNTGDDILIGGTEDFNSNVDGDNRGSDNRDRAFGNEGNDTFLWAPGDGSDYFDGGEGTDVLILGLLGEQRDASGNTEGAPFFAVNPPGTEGSQDFDGIFTDANGLPRMSVSTSPGFCTVTDNSTQAAALEALKLDHIVSFTIRGIADAFDAGARTDDDGLRISISAESVEYLVCAARTTVEGGGLDNVEVLDLTTTPPTLALLSDLPEHVQSLVQ